MKKYSILCFSILFYLQISYSQSSGEWVWLHGDSAGNFLGNFGVQGIPNPNNTPPGLYEACEWRDLNGNFWLYGGYGINNGSYAALWKYDPLTNEWTWMKGPSTQNYSGSYGIMGVPSVNNLPPSKSLGMASWTDMNNNLWFFGGIGFPNSHNDLWKYDVSANEWTWMHGWGSSAVYGLLGVSDTAYSPGIRLETAAAWNTFDSSLNEEKLWLFGGDNDVDKLNDLWNFNINTNSWTWLKGSNLIGQPNIYGQLGVEDSANTPSARWIYSKWKDKKNDFWIFGGVDGDGWKNDLWRYNSSSNNWTWMNGLNGFNSFGNYGSKCTITSTNLPRSRYENRTSWTDSNGNFWMFGGLSLGGNACLNDLWLYCTTINQWVWISNDSVVLYNCNWGTKGVSNLLNKPGARWGALSWYDNIGHLYLFGGFGFYSNGSVNNDLWKYTIDTACYCPSYLSTQALLKKSQIQIYPNPTSGLFKISLSQKIKNGKINIINVLSENIFTAPFNEIEETFNLTLAPGIYLVNIYCDNDLFSKKLIFE